MRRDLRLVALAALCAVPATWSATLGAETRTEIVNQALASLLLGTLPLLGAMLFWNDRFSGERLEVRYGANRRSYAARSLLAAAALLVFFGVSGAALTIIVHRSPRDPLLLKDLVATVPIVIAGGLAVAAFLGCWRFLLGRLGLVVALILTWVLGSLELPISAAVPTGHVRSLIGLGAQLPFAPWLSFVCLYAMTLLTGAAALLRVPK